MSSYVNGCNLGSASRRRRRSEVKQEDVVQQNQFGQMKQAQEEEGLIANVKEYLISDVI